MLVSFFFFFFYSSHNMIQKKERVKRGGGKVRWVATHAEMEVSLKITSLLYVCLWWTCQCNWCKCLHRHFDNVLSKLMLLQSWRGFAKGIYAIWVNLRVNQIQQRQGWKEKGRGRRWIVLQSSTCWRQDPISLWRGRIWGTCVPWFLVVHRHSYGGWRWSCISVLFLQWRGSC